MTMAESNENIAKSCENPKENGAKVSASPKANSLTNGKQSVVAVVNGNSAEKSKSIISQKQSPTPTHKSPLTPSQSPSCTTEASSFMHVAKKAEEKSRSESKGTHETPSKDKKNQDGHGKDLLLAL